jgi:CheY-like chemotaxis protein
MIETRKLRIIVIDDDPAVNVLLKTALSTQGHHVFTFPDPTAYPCHVLKQPSCSCLQEFPCTDIIISDIEMPNMSGIDFFRTQRAGNCKAPDENKALVSATIIEEHFDAAVELGCHFFKKPFKLVDIIQWVKECAKRIPEDRVLADLG